VQSFLDRAASLLGPDAVVREEQALAALTACTTGSHRVIAGAVYPTSTEQVQQIVALAREQNVALYAVSTGHNWGYGSSSPVVDGCILLSLARMRRLEVDAELGLAVVEPGVTQRQLANHFDANALPFMVPTTGAGPEASLVGNALERGYGITPITDHFAAVTSVEAVLPDGSRYESPIAAAGAPGVARVYKWGIGPYVDGLFAQGSFGIVTKLTIALARRPEAAKAFLFGLRDDALLESAVTSIRDVLARLPGTVGGVNLMNARRVLAMSVPYPLDKLGPDGLIAEAALRDDARRLRIQPWTGFGMLFGTAEVVAVAMREVRRQLKPIATGMTFVSVAGVQRLTRIASAVPSLRARFGPRLQLLKSALELVGGRPNETALPLAYWKSGRRPAPGTPLDPARDGCGLIWYAPLLEMKPDRVRNYVQHVSTTMLQHGFEPLITLSSLSERCFGSSIPILFDPRKRAESEAARDCHLALLEAGLRNGFFPYRIGIDAMGWLAAQRERNPGFQEFASTLKRSADPTGTLSPGRYV
jgi:4-cresol dehydrogenase (hydroxylating)